MAKLGYKMSKIDINYWLKNIKYGQIRGQIILYCLDLMNKNYQMKKWLVDGDETSFRYNIHYAFEFLVEDLMEDYIDSNIVPSEQIGEYLKTENEATILLEVAKKLDKLVLSCRTNPEYLSSPYLSPMRKAAKECFAIFMENEKDNNEFCDFVLRVIEEEHHYIPDKKKTSYENIELFIKSV